MRRRMIYKNKPQPIPITDLTGTKWYFNETLYGVDYKFVLYLDFISNSRKFSILAGTYMRNRLLYTNTLSLGEVVYSSGREDEKWRTIEITGGDDVKSEEAIQWLQENATLVV